MEKVKVTKEVAEAIEYQLSKRSKEALLLDKAKYVNGLGFFINRSAVLNGLTFDELARALYADYEVEKTPEEELADYVKKRENARRTSGNLEERFLHTGFIEGVEFAVNKLGIRIEGVNA